MKIFAGQYITAPLHNGGDGIMIFGEDGQTVIAACIIDFSAHSVATLDEALSGIKGAQARVLQSRLRGAGKLVLWGNGDWPAEDKGASLYMDGCILSDFGRRGPEAQDGARVYRRGTLAGVF